MARFIKWIQDKPSDFNPPTKRSRNKGMYWSVKSRLLSGITTSVTKNFIEQKRWNYLQTI
jgi:hypothetical protein